MRKLIAAMKVSVDGRSENAQGHADWVDAWSEDYGLMDRIDACLIGAGMYPGYAHYWSAIRQAPESPLPMTDRWPSAQELVWREFASRTPHYVLSSTLQAAAWPKTRVLRDVDDVRDRKEPVRHMDLLSVRALDAGRVHLAYRLA